MILVDELGYLQLDRRGAELLFQVLTEREERSAIAIASNEPFSSWTKTFTDPRLCAAVVDRLKFAGMIIETGSTLLPTSPRPQRPPCKLSPLDLGKSCRVEQVEAFILLNAQELRRCQAAIPDESLRAQPAPSDETGSGWLSTGPGLGPRQSSASNGRSHRPATIRPEGSVAWLMRGTPGGSCRFGFRRRGPAQPRPLVGG